ncbi:MAG: methylated-DNA--[protein]-cysteine S-methyltransferase [Candidatus Bathyarchaeia archaeon]
MLNLYIQEIEGLWCGVALERDRIFATTFAFSQEDALRSLLNELPHNSVFEVNQESNIFAKKILETIKAICHGEDVSFDFPLALGRLSTYAKRVLRFTWMIPTGYVTTYGALAKVAGGSPRSVGRVMATNPFAPLIPCHRVVAADMTLGGYGGGIKIKWSILKKENRNFGKVVEARVNEKTLRLFPISMVKSSKRECDAHL